MNRGRMVYVLFCVTVLFALTSCSHRTLAEEVKLDLDKVVEVRITTARQSSQTLDPAGSLEWHQISRGEELGSFVRLLGAARRTGRAETPFPEGDGVITLVLEPHQLYGLRYFTGDGKLLDLHTGMWYAFPEGLGEVLNHPEAIPIVRKWD